MYGVDGALLSRQYREHSSDFRDWEQRAHASEYVLFRQNLGPRLSIDETCLSQGEIYTIVTSKSARRRKGSLVAMIRGTRADDIVWVLSRLPRSLRLRAEEVTLDLFPSMKLIVKRAFPRATQVSDRFHVQRLMNEAISDLRVDYRWQAIYQENAEIALAKEVGRPFVPHVFENGDTRRQLLASSRHIVMKHHSRWTDSQRRRAEILFREYPALAEAYHVSIELTDIYNWRITPGVALSKLARWYDKVERLGLKFFRSVIETMQNNYGSICNCFENRSTNAAAESFNAKVKAFRSQLRGLTGIPFFIFRLAKLFA
jgi:transposase